MRRLCGWQDGSMRRLLLLASAVVFIDVAFYTAVTPLLPHYVDDLDLSKGQAGVLAAAYAAGTLVASLPGGLLAARAGPRRTLISGLLLIGVSSLVFGFAHHLLLLDAARFVQGIAGALTWSGALSWLIAATPESRRGSAIGGVLGIAIAGALLGPLLGALAVQIGTKPVFSSVLVLTSALAIVALGVRERGRAEPDRLRDVTASITSRPVLTATWYVAAPSVMFGAFSVLVPLRIHELGGGAGLVAAGFAAGSGLEAVMAPLIGRLSDRVGRLRPFAAGLLFCAITIAAIPVPQALGPMLAVAVSIAFGAGLCFAPAMTMLSDAAAATGLHQGFSAGLTNMAWAAGQVSGAVGGGVVAGAAGDALPSLLTAALLLATATAAWRAGEGRTGRPSPAEVTT
jgi:MFS family permease